MSIFLDISVSGIAGADGPQTLISTGYDPTTGLRSIVLGSAVSQVVPLNNFLIGKNEQIYNTTPQIVPLVDALVFNVTQYNRLNATSFNLPIFYSRAQVTTGRYYVNKIENNVTSNNVPCGQTAVFQGGPGYTDAGATTLTETSTSATTIGDLTFTTYTSNTASVVSTEKLGTKVHLGAVTMTTSSRPLSTAFSQQRIVGFYRDNNWTTCLGIPIFDFGELNGTFTATFQPQANPILIYNPTTPFLNGSTLQNVIQSFTNDTVYSADDLMATMLTSIAAKDTSSGPGMCIMAAGLDFAPAPASSAALLDDLAVPVLADFLTTPLLIPRPAHFDRSVEVIGPEGSTPSSSEPFMKPALSLRSPSVVVESSHATIAPPAATETPGNTPDSAPVLASAPVTTHHAAVNPAPTTISHAPVDIPRPILQPTSPIILHF